MNLEKQIKQKVGVPSQKEALSLVPKIKEHLTNPERSPKSTQYPNVLGSRPLAGPRSLVDHYEWFEDEDVQKEEETKGKIIEEATLKKTSPRRKKKDDST